MKGEERGVTSPASVCKLSKGGDDGRAASGSHSGYPSASADVCEVGGSHGGLDHEGDATACGRLGCGCGASGTTASRWGVQRCGISLKDMQLKEMQALQTGEETEHELGQRQRNDNQQVTYVVCVHVQMYI